MRAIGPDGERNDDGLKRQPVRRHAGRSDHEGQAVLLRRATRPRRFGSGPRRTSRGCRRRRCWRVISRRSPRRSATAGRQVTLRAPYREQPDRSRRSSVRPALNLARRLPSTTDPCGQITYDGRADRDEEQTLARIDYQTGTKHSFFGRYLRARGSRRPPGYAGGDDNILKTSARARTCLVALDDLGATTVLQLVDGQRRCGSRSTRRGRQFPDPVLLAEGHRCQHLLLRARATW